MRFPDWLIKAQRNSTSASASFDTTRLRSLAYRSFHGRLGHCRWKASAGAVDRGTFPLRLDWTCVFYHAIFADHSSGIQINSIYRCIRIKEICNSGFGRNLQNRAENRIYWLIEYGPRNLLGNHVCGFDWKCDCEKQDGEKNWKIAFSNVFKEDRKQ